MAVHELSFPITDPAEILKLRAGDEVTVQGHIIGIRDRTQIRIFDQGVEPPMDLAGAFLLHTAPNVRKLGPGRYEKLCIGTTTSARMVRFTEPLGEQLRRPRDLRQGRLPRRGDRADAAARDGLLRDRRRRRRARDDPDRGDRGGRLGGAHARVPLEVPRQGLRPAHRRDRRARQLALPRRPGRGQTRSWRRSLPAFDLDASASERRPHPRARQGPRPARPGRTSSRPRGDYIDIVKLGWGTAYVTPQPRAQARGARGQAGRHRRHVLRGRLRSRTGSTSTSAGCASSASPTSRSPTARSRSRASASSS